MNYEEKLLTLYENCLFRFLIIGAFGTILNLIVFYIFSDYFNFNVTLSSIIAFCFAVTHNYVFNHLWSFKGYVLNTLNFKSYFKYVFINIFGLIINIIILNIILLKFNPDLKIIAQFIGVLAGTFFNFLLSRYFVFNRNL
jgi:putative flippase GtrA